MTLRHWVTCIRLPMAVYLGVIAAWAIAGRTPIATWWAYQLADIFAGWLIPPLPGLWRVLFRRRTPCSAGLRLRVLTSNVLWTNHDAESFCRLVDRERPDLIILQELNTLLAEQVATALADRYPFQAIHSDRSWMGMGVLSRIPITQSVVHAAARATGCLQEVRCRIGGRDITILNVHPSAPALRVARLSWLKVPRWFDPARPGRILQTVLQRVDQLDDALIVAGDFNVAPRQAWYRVLTTRLTDSHTEAGGMHGHTFPSRAIALVRLDYVFHNSAWVARRSWTGELTGSDHRYVAADLQLLA